MIITGPFEYINRSCFDKRYLQRFLEILSDSSKNKTDFSIKR